MASPTTLNTTGPVVRAHAKLRYSTVTPMKARRVIDLVRGLPAEEALSILKFTPQSASEPVYKVLESAIANAEHNNGADIDELKITSICVEKGPVLKRFQARAKGRGNRIVKPTCHVFLTVGDGKKD